MVNEPKNTYMDKVPIIQTQFTKRINNTNALDQQGLALFLKDLIDVVYFISLKHSSTYLSRSPYVIYFTELIAETSQLSNHLKSS